MVAISILLIASGAIGWKMHGMVAKKKCTANSEKIQSRLLTCRRLALNMQADWKGLLEHKGKKWSFSAYCIDNPKTPALPPLLLDLEAISLNGEKQEYLLFDFTANGDVFPQGSLRIHGDKSHVVEWKLPDLFSLEQGKNFGPVHPDDIDKK